MFSSDDRGRSNWINLKKKKEIIMYIIVVFVFIWIRFGFNDVKQPNATENQTLTPAYIVYYLNRSAIIDKADALRMFMYSKWKMFVFYSHRTCTVKLHYSPAASTITIHKPDKLGEFTMRKVNEKPQIVFINIQKCSLKFNCNC